MSRSKPLPVPADVERRVEDRAYASLLGYPRARLPEGRVARLAAESRRWFRRHATPWGQAQEVPVIRVEGDLVELAGGSALTGPALAERLREASSTALIVAVVSAGAEVDRRSAALWEGDRPDEAYFLDRLGAAVARQLAAWAGHHLRQQAARKGLDALPGSSPGFDGWPLGDQQHLSDRLASQLPPSAGFEALSSGMLRPKNSLLAVFGLTALSEVADTAWSRHRCSWCSLADCRLRRGAFVAGGVET